MSLGLRRFRGRWRALVVLGVAVLVTAVLIPAPAWARPVTLRPVNLGQGGLDPATILPLLKRGQLALIENAPSGKLAQCTVIALTKAGPAAMWDVLFKPESWPKFSRNMVDVVVKERSDKHVQFEYELELPLRNMAIGSIVRRVDDTTAVVEIAGGDLKTGAWRWNVVPAPTGSGAIVVHTVYTDIGETAWVLRQLIKAEPTLEHGINVASALVAVQAMIRNAEGRGEGIAGGATHPVSVERFSAGGAPYDWTQLKSLLKRGMINLVENWPDGTLKQISIVQMARANAASLFATVGNPVAYPEFVANIGSVEITARAKNDPNKFKMKTKLNLPLVNLTFGSKMILRPESEIDHIPFEGSITRARWLWGFTPLDSTAALAEYYFYTDLRESSRILDFFLKREPAMEHGLNIAGGIVVVKNMVKRAESTAPPPTSNSRSPGPGTAEAEKP